VSLQSLVSWVQKAAESVGSAVTSAVKTAGEVVKKAQEAERSVGEKIISTIHSGIQTAENWISGTEDKAKEPIDKNTDRGNEKKNETVEKVKETIEDRINEISWLPDWAKDLLKAIVATTIDSVWSLVEPVYNQIKWLIQQLIDEAEKALGPLADAFFLAIHYFTEELKKMFDIKLEDILDYQEQLWKLQVERLMKR
jgi:phage-related protein